MQTHNSFSASQGFRRLSTKRAEVQAFQEVADSAEADAHETANTVLRNRFKYVRKPTPEGLNPSSRQSTLGNFTEKFQYTREGNGFISLNVDQLNRSVVADYWMVQEVGTGPKGRGRMLEYGLSPDGKKVRVGIANIIIRSQKGRELPANLQWSDESRRFFRPSRGRFRQDYISPVYQGGDSDESRDTSRGDGLSRESALIDFKMRPLRIRKEIRGKHFVRDASVEGAKALRGPLISYFESKLKHQ